MKRYRGVGAFFIVGLLLAGLIGGAAFYEAAHVGSIYPGVHAGSLDLGNLSKDQAAARLQQSLHDLSSRRLVAQYRGQTWSTSLGALGLHYDVPATVNAAYAVGRQADPLARLGQQFLAPLAAPAVTPVYTIDEARLDGFVHSLATAIDHPVQDAGVRLTGTQLTVTPAQDGQRLDEADTLTQLRTRIAQLSTAPVALKVTVTAPATGNGAVAAAIAQARRWVSSSLTVETPIGSTVMSQTQIASLIHLSQASGSGPMVASLDTAALRDMLTPLAKQMAQPTSDATFAISNGALVVAQPGQVGRSLDLGAAVTAVTTAIQAGQGAVRLPVKETPPDLYSLEDAADVQQKVAQIAGQPLTIQAANKTWTLSPNDLSAFLQLGVAQDGRRKHLTLTVLTDQVAAVIQKIAGEVDQPAQNARFQWANGKLTLTAPSQDGRQVDQVSATQALLQAMQGGRRTVALPVTVVKAAVAGAHPERLGVTELVAQGTSNFAGSPPDRIQNIRRGAELIDGTIIAPGQVFSFDDTVGDISVANGFTTGLVILNHETQNGIGGGICQVSTTLFRAAFYAGVPILERHDHAYAVPYYTQGGYPEGFDATIYSPQLDFKFKNDTSASLLIQTSMDVATNMLTVSLYGTKTGRVVQLIDGPITNRTAHPPDLLKPDPQLPKGVTQQVDWSHDGFDTWVKRVITLNGKVTSTDVFTSHAQPWQAIYLVGTGPASAGQPPKKA